MASRSIALAKWLLVLGAALPVSACAAAAVGAGAGAAGAIYLTSRGAKALVQGSVDDLATRSKAVMAEEGMVQTASSSEKGGDKQELKGKKGNLDVTISLERQGAATTNVEVSARKSLAEWDKNYAQQVLSRIVQKG